MRRELKYILNIAKINKRETNRIITFSLLYILLEAVIPFFVRELLNSITRGEALYIIKLFSGVIILYSFTRLFWAFSDYEVAKLKICAKGDLKKRLHEKMIKLPINYFSHNLPGEIITKMTADVEIIGENSPLLPAILSAFIEIIVIGFVLFKLNPILALITIATFPIYSILEKRYKPRLEKSAEEERKASDPIVEMIRENIAGIFTLKLFKPYKYLESIFNKKIDEWKKISKYRAQCFYVYYGLTSYIEYTLPLVILGVGSILVANRAVDFPTVVAFFAFVSRVYVPVWNINFLLTTIPGAYPSIRRILEILEHPEEKITIGDSFPKIIDKIILKDVSFSYDRGKILRELNLEIQGKSWTAVVGATGNGKTTLCLLLSGLYKPESGFILLNGKPYSNYDSTQLSKNIIYVPNKDFIFNASLKDNLTFGEIYNEHEIKNICEICCIDEFTKDLNVNATNFSDGQKQRIALARALLRKPSFIILDETFAAIDSKIEEIIVYNIKKNYPALTVVVVSHRLSTIHNADQIVVMKDGRIIATGTHSLLSKNCEEYRILFERQYIID
jgi:ABC-type multidrug transport system fused ATPase/permease subunit